MAVTKISEMPIITKSELDDNDMILMTDVSEKGTKKSKILTIGTLKSVCKGLLESAYVDEESKELVIVFTSGDNIRVDLSKLVQTEKAELDSIIEDARSVEVTIGDSTKKFYELTNEDMNVLSVGQLANAVRSTLRILSKQEPPHDPEE